MIINSRFFNRSELVGFISLALLLIVILPLTLDIFRLNLVAKYLTYAYVVIGLGCVHDRSHDACGSGQPR